MGRTKQTRRRKAKTIKAQPVERPTLFSLGNEVIALDAKFLTAYMAVAGRINGRFLALDPIASAYQAQIRSLANDSTWINNVTDEQLEQFKRELDGFRDELDEWADKWKVNLDKI